MTERLDIRCAIYAGLAFLLASNSALAADGIDRDACMWNGFPLNGRVQIVESFPDIKIERVSSFPDLKVKVVESFPDNCGEWKFVDSFPDVKIQYVNSFPDIKVKFVESFPGWP